MLYLLGMNMFERVELLLEEKINKLKDKTILVLGIGGVGSYTVETLIRNPIKKIIIIHVRAEK